MYFASLNTNMHRNSWSIPHGKLWEHMHVYGRLEELHNGKDWWRGLLHFHSPIKIAIEKLEIKIQPQARD